MQQRSIGANRLKLSRIQIFFIVIIFVFILFIFYASRLSSNESQLKQQEIQQLKRTVLEKDIKIEQHKQKIIELEMHQKKDKQDLREVQQLLREKSHVPCSRNTLTTTYVPEELLLDSNPVIPDSTPSFNILKYATFNEAFRDYLQFHKEALTKLTDKETMLESKIRLMLIQPTQGWGNVVRSVTSALYMAMITGRVLLIEWKPDPLSKYFEQIDMQWELKKEHRAVMGYRECEIFKYDVCGTQCEENLKKVKATDLNVLYPAATKCVKLVTYSPMNEWLEESPYHRGLFKRLSGTEEWKQIYHLFFGKPTPLVEALIRRHVDRMKTASLIYGIQIRTGSTGDSKEGRFITEHTLATIKDCIDRIYEATDSKTLFTLTIDNDRYKEEFLSRGTQILDRLIMTAGNNMHTFKKPDYLPKAIADWVLLSRTDVMILSPQSSFGNTAHRMKYGPVFYLANDDQKQDMNILNSEYFISAPPVCKDLFPNHPLQ
jgi:hypothetical protein